LKVEGGTGICEPIALGAGIAITVGDEVVGAIGAAGAVGGDLEKTVPPSSGTRQPTSKDRSIGREMARPAENGHGWARRGSLGRSSGQGSHAGTGCYDDAHHQIGLFFPR